MRHLLTCALLAATPAQASEKEWHVAFIGALELPGLASQSPTDFDLATWSTGLEATYGVTHWLQLGGRVVYSEVDGAIEGYATRTEGGTTFIGTLFVDMSAWRTEALVHLHLARGFALQPYLTLGGGYTWTVYADPVLTVDGGSVPVDGGSGDFADGSLTTSAALSVAWRALPFLEITIGAELSRYFDGLYETAVRFPISISGVFWGPL